MVLYRRRKRTGIKMVKHIYTDRDLLLIVTEKRAGPNNCVAGHRIIMMRNVGCGQHLWLQSKCMEYHITGTL